MASGSKRGRKWHRTNQNMLKKAPIDQTLEIISLLIHYKICGYLLRDGSRWLTGPLLSSAHGPNSLSVNSLLKGNGPIQIVSQYRRGAPSRPLQQLTSVNIWNLIVLSDPCGFIFASFLDLFICYLVQCLIHSYRTIESMYFGCIFFSN